MNTDISEVIEMETEVPLVEYTAELVKSILAENGVVVRGRHPKIYNIHTNNTPYLAYLETLPENTSYQYGLTVKNFLQSLGQKTPKRVTVDELIAFVGDSTVKRVHIRGFFNWAFETNVANIKADVSREVLFWLL